jgi:acetyl/propionyl-CoA carboxylase alpha subunit
VGAGTVEFLLAPDGRFFFLEMNTRLQVEHPVTELVTGLDLVALQIAVAEGASLPPEALNPQQRGHAIEVRLCAEDPAAGYLPQTGTLERFEFDGGPHVRLDSGVETGSVVPPYYDSMLAKLVAWGPTREAAARTLAAAVAGSRIHGVVTNRRQLVQILRHPEFLAGNIDTGFLERHPCTEAPAVDPAPAALAAALAVQAGHRCSARVLAAVPSGWRTVPSQDQRVDLALGEQPFAVTYRLDRRGALAHAAVDGAPMAAALDIATPEQVVLHLDGVRTLFRVHLTERHAEVDGPGGAWSFVRLPRFPLPDDAGLAGSLVAPMPGSILRVLAAVGDAVVPGQPLVVLEAMKMEHQVVAPRAGIVSALLVLPGDQVVIGQPLLVLEES